MDYDCFGFPIWVQLFVLAALEHAELKIASAAVVDVESKKMILVTNEKDNATGKHNEKDYTIRYSIKYGQGHTLDIAYYLFRDEDRANLGGGIYKITDYGNNPILNRIADF